MKNNKTIPENKKEINTKELFELARKPFKFTALPTQKKCKKERKRLEEAYESRDVDENKSHKTNDLSKLLAIIRSSNYAQIEDIETIKLLALHEKYQKIATHYIREFLKENVVPYHKIGKLYYVKSNVAEPLYYDFLYGIFIKWSIEINSEIKEYKNESLKCYVNQSKYDKYTVQIKKLQSEIITLSETIDYLKKMKYATKEYMHISKTRDVFNDTVIDEARKDEFAETVYRVLNANQIGMTITTIPKVIVDCIIALPPKKQVEWKERYIKNEERKRNQEIEDYVAQTKRDIVFDYITKHCIEIDEEKLRNDISMEYASESVPAHAYEYENRLRLKDLSNYYKVVSPQNHQNKKKS